MLQGIPLVIVFVSDLDRSLQWYQQAFDLPLLWRHGDFANLQIGDVRLALHASSQAGGTSQNSGSMPVFQVEDYPAAKSELERRGCEFVYEDRTPASIFGTILDPDGNPLQIMEDL